MHLLHIIWLLSNRFSFQWCEMNCNRWYNRPSQCWFSASLSELDDLYYQKFSYFYNTFIAWIKQINAVKIINVRMMDMNRSINPPNCLPMIFWPHLTIMRSVRPLHLVWLAHKIPKYQFYLGTRYIRYDMANIIWAIWHEIN